MKPKPKTKDARRAETLDALMAAGRAMSTVTVMFHTVMAEKQGLKASEEKAIELLDRFGPMTAGELSERSGLAPASVTGLIDRLEHKGFARRVLDADDKRRVRIELDPHSRERFAPLFEDFVARLHKLYAGYTTEQLELVLRFMREATAIQQEATEALRRFE